MTTTDIGAKLSDAEHSQQLKRAVIASTVGTAIEWYDFFLYGVVTPLIFAKLYFPNDDPLVGTLQEQLGVPTVLMGFALPDDRMHAPNEKFHLPTFGRAIRTILWFLARVGRDDRATPAGGIAGMRSGFTDRRRPGRRHLQRRLQSLTSVPIRGI